MYCNAPFGSIKLKDNKASICCNDNYIINTNNQWYSNDVLRKSILTNTITKNCKNCNLKDLYSNLSEFEEEIVKYNILQYCKKTYNYKIFFADITLGHICNNDCMICQKIKVNQDTKATLSQNNIEILLKNKDNITRCIFMGGESFLYTKEILYYIKQFKNLKFLSIVSNGSLYDHEFLEYLDKLHIDVNITISIDGNCKTNNLIRVKSNYNRIVNNIIRMSKFKNIKLGFNVTVSLLNCLDISSIISDIYSVCSKNNIISTLTLNKLIYPFYLCIDNIDDENIENILNRELIAIKKYNDKFLNIKDYSDITINKKGYTTKFFKARMMKLFYDYRKKYNIHYSSYLNSNMKNFIFENNTFNGESYDYKI